MKTRKQLENADDRIFGGIVIVALMVAVGYAGTVKAADHPDMGPRVIQLEAPRHATWLPRLTRAIQRKGFSVVGEGARYALVVDAAQGGLRTVSGGCDLAGTTTGVVTAELVDVDTAEGLSDQVSTGTAMGCSLVSDDVAENIARMVADAWSKQK